MKTTTLILCMAVMACSKRAPECTNGTTGHRFGKWEDTGQTSGAGTNWLKRRCENCGWQEERGARLP